MPTFVLNDETKVNSYGFRVPNSGIDLARFESNPVMLDNHYSSSETVIGRWENIRIEGSLLLADPVFDTEDDHSRKIAGKVDRGFLKGVSMGLARTEGTKFYETVEGILELSPCEITEASICPIPSNANAIKLYAQNGELIPEEEIKLSISELSKNVNNKNQEEMKKIILSLSALQVLGLQNTDDNDAIALAIENTTAELSRLKAENTQLKEQFENQTKLSATTIVEKAIVDGKLTADAKESWIKMGVIDLANMTKTIEAIPSKLNLSGMTNNPADGGEVKTVEDFMKLSIEEKKAFQADNREAYDKLFA